MNYQLINSTVFIFKSMNLLDILKSALWAMFLVLTGGLVGYIGYHVRSVFK